MNNLDRNVLNDIEVKLDDLANNAEFDNNLSNIVDKISNVLHITCHNDNTIVIIQFY